MTPTLSTSRLVLRQLRKPTSRNLVWLNDPEVTRYSEQRHREHTLSTQLRYVNSFVGNSHLWGIYRVENNEQIGNLSAMNDEPNNVSEIGIMIGEAKYWGHGYGTEAWKAACNWLIDKDGGHVRKLEAGCMHTNEGMMKIIQGSGFKQEGERLNHFLQGGNPVNAVFFGRFK